MCCTSIFGALNRVGTLHLGDEKKEVNEDKILPKQQDLGTFRKKKHSFYAITIHKLHTYII